MSHDPNNPRRPGYNPLLSSLEDSSPTSSTGATFRLVLIIFLAIMFISMCSAMPDSDEPVAQKQSFGSYLHGLGKPVGN